MGRSARAIGAVERSTFRRCAAAGTLALVLGVAGDWATSGGAFAACSCAGESGSRVLADALVRFESQLPLVQFSQYLGRALLQRIGLRS